MTAHEIVPPDYSQALKMGASKMGYCARERALAGVRADANRC